MPRNPLLCAISWYHHGMQGNVAVVDSQLLSERQRSWALADSPWEELTVCFAEVGGGGGGVITPSFRYSVVLEHSLVEHSVKAKRQDAGPLLPSYIHTHIHPTSSHRCQ
jgi:hypothetical protein